MDDDFDDFRDDMEDVVEDYVEDTVTEIEEGGERPVKRSKSAAGGAGSAEDGEEGDSGAVVEVWQRPEAPGLDTEPKHDPSLHPIVFQWMTIDICAGEPLKANPAPGRLVAGSKNKPVPILHAFGVTDSGHSVMARIHGFTPYFYFNAPPGCTRAHLPAIKGALEHAVRDSVLYYAQGCDIALYAPRELRMRFVIVTAHGSRVASNRRLAGDYALYMNVLVVIEGNLASTRPG